jgi:hypothetical protein
MVIFIGFVRLLHGPTEADSTMSLYSTWAIAHGQWACAYPSNKGGGIEFIAPLYPLLSGGLAALAHVGSSVPFPSQAAMGSHCANAVDVMTRWSLRSNAIASTVKFGFLGWLFVMAGVVALLRAVGRGGRMWEFVALVLVAASPAVWFPLQEYFHPQDLLAMGLVLASLACVVRGRWGWAGVSLGLALMSQQFPWLCVVPLVVVAPPSRRLRFATGAIAAAAIVVVPFIVATAGRVIGPSLLGSGGSPSAFGGTLVWELHLHGASFIATSRLLPIFASMVVAWWAVGRLGSGVLEPVPLISLITTSLDLRLVFEVSLWGYYLFAVTLMLIVLNVVCGRIRPCLVAWIALTAVAFYPSTWGMETLGQEVPRWLWQIVLVSGALALGAGPLVRAARHRAQGEPEHRSALPALIES